jgi:hypothetical protein
MDWSDLLNVNPLYAAGNAASNANTSGIDWTKYLFGGSALSPQSMMQQNPYAQQVLQQYGSAMGQQAPQLAGGPQDQFRDMQVQQAQQLQRIASGQQQGAGELATQRQVQNAAAGQQAMARMARGSNAGLALRGAANNTAGIGLAGAGQAQQSALQDQQMAQGQLAGVTQAGRGSDINFAGQNANLQMQQQQLQQLYAQLLQQMGQGQLNTMGQMYGSAQSNPGVLGGLISGAGQGIGKAAMGA